MADKNVNSDAVKKLREFRLWTQEDLAEAAKVHTRTIQRIESVGVASSKSAAAVAKALGIEIDEILSDKPSTAPLTEFDSIADSAVWTLIAAIGALAGAGVGYVHAMLTGAQLEELIWNGAIWGASISMLIGFPFLAIKKASIQKK